MNDFADSDCGCSKAFCQSSSESTGLLMLPSELLQAIVRLCDDPATLANLNLVCSAFRAFDAGAGLKLVEKIAKSSVIAAAGAEHAGRWR